MRRAELEIHINNINTCNETVNLNLNDKSEERNSIMFEQVNNELNKYKDKNKELEMSLEQLLTLSSKNANDKKFMMELDNIDNN
jgi:hypothetical protein